MKEKLIELLGGLPFFLLATDGKIKPNWTRMFELVVIAFATAVATTYMTTAELKTKLGYIELANQEMKTQITKTYDKLETMQSKMASIDALQQERIARERHR